MWRKNDGIDIKICIIQKWKKKNNFKGAFELKSANGAFGIRIEVQQGRHVPY